MSPDECIAALDAALVPGGEDVVLRRVIATGGSNSVNIDVKCRAIVRTYRLREDELIGALKEAADLVTLSPSPIAAKKWPGGQIAGLTPDPSLPRRGDRILIKGRWRTIETADPIAVGGKVVRIDLMVLG